MSDKSCGLYIHVPFCTSKCSYCAFAVVHNRLGSQESYFSALSAELESYTSVGGGPVPLRGFDTVFFGGGTPSLVDPYLVKELIHKVPLSPEAEVSIEVNPESVSPSQLEIYLAGGITRVSVGIQSFDAEVLNYFGRSHDRERAIASIREIGAAGFDSVSVDLVYGALVESRDSWRATIDTLLDLSGHLDHVSAYALTVEPRTKLHWQAGVGLDEASLLDRYLMLEQGLSAAGFVNYEVSNWARPGSESRHNLNYWVGGRYLGIGMSSHSYDGSVRSWNCSNLSGYFEMIAKSGSAVVGSETLTSDQKATERIMLGLRTRGGLPSDEVLSSGRFTPSELNRWFIFDGSRAYLNAQARFLADGIALRLLSERRFGG